MKTVLITGCSDGGIGQSLAEEFARQGCHVYATARKVSSMSKLTAIPTVTLLQLDVNSQESIDACKAYVEKSTGGRLDVLVNNAGISYTGPAVELDIDICRQLMETNLFAVMAMNKAFVKMLIAAKGTILSTGSVAGIIPTPWGSIYHASKAALHMYSDCMRIELEPFGVKVVTAVTGGVQSNIVVNAAPRFKLIEGTIYENVRSFMEQRLNTSQGAGTCPRDVYARSVVSQTLRSNPPPRIWKGAFATMIRLLNIFAPYWLTARIMSRRFGIDKMKGLLKSA
jgi:1-acylglycerone phosphate reductase